MKDYIINTPSDFNLKETLECGQCFHFNMIDENEYVLTAYGHMLHIRQDDKILYFMIQMTEHTMNCGENILI